MNKDQKTYDEALAELNAVMKHVEGALAEGDMGEDEFKQAVNYYMKGVILRARLQSGKTLKEMK